MFGRGINITLFTSSWEPAECDELATGIGSPAQAWASAISSDRLMLARWRYVLIHNIIG